MCTKQSDAEDEATKGGKPREGMSGGSTASDDRQGEPVPVQEGGGRAAGGGGQGNRKGGEVKERLEAVLRKVKSHGLLGVGAGRGGIRLTHRGHWRPSQATPIRPRTYTRARCLLCAPPAPSAPVSLFACEHAIHLAVSSCHEHAFVFPCSPPPPRPLTSEPTPSLSPTLTQRQLEHSHGRVAHNLEQLSLDFLARGQGQKFIHEHVDRRLVDLLPVQVILRTCVILE